ncbi:MAG TPA: hypothetical protein VM639_11770 [Dongiaceae bacterium]|nr:hypothetical protein [Dongiaceae bacterium]
MTQINVGQPAGDHISGSFIQAHPATHLARHSNKISMDRHNGHAAAQRD